MYEHLSSRVDQVIKLANAIAREYEQEYVGTEHILLAISREGTGIGARILNAHGASEARIQEEIDKLIRSRLEDTWVFGRLPGSPHFKNVVARAIEEARALGNKEVCTEHLLLGLLAEKGCTAHSALRALGLTARAVRADIQAIKAGSDCGRDTVAEQS
ncbi:MAG TPA: Clp protease N-terminal domain-containing protein [Phycisphaerae bacterium]|jgi:ATP-dependent Clp protease ATP-binding subunit ClpC|nr:ATP-dependent Clp protease ATP-binding subunit [Phycisphaerae bacterium]HOB75650.1 Clp protease N-terminal domain-containing protein [Phycisphaerae bacterium]HOJ56323.1 Clp protease N-terminal domain-containing protein [Phycisphaerae bacterium]HOL28176.1 Clp protease N-terminal domain-containing protein [Phycisphaerae bacterium]HPP22470.1 Clp protease N-terminal domain-containing protein [Phycisphaerae bacterium]